MFINTNNVYTQRNEKQVQYNNITLESNKKLTVIFFVQLSYYVILSSKLITVSRFFLPLEGRCA